MGSLCFFLFSFVINVKFHMDILHSVIACFTLLVDSRSFDTTKWMIFVTNIDVKKIFFSKIAVTCPIIHWTNQRLWLHSGHFTDETAADSVV